MNDVRRCFLKCGCQRRSRQRMLWSIVGDINGHTESRVPHFTLSLSLLP